MATHGTKRNTYVILGTFTGIKGFRKGDKLQVTFVPDVPKKVECLGPSPKGKTVTKWVDVKELADLQIVWEGVGRKRESLAEELERILIQAAKS